MTNLRPPLTLLAGTRVVELSGTYASAFCAKLLADLGAAVDRLNPPGAPASIDDAAERAFVHASKRIVPFDARDPLDVGAATKRIRDADVLVASTLPRWLTDEARRPSLVTVLVTDFGSEGPYAGWKGTSLLTYAAGGYLQIDGDPDREPLQGLDHMTSTLAGASAALAVIAALIERDRSGLGQAVTASEMQTLATLHELTTLYYTHGGRTLSRSGNRYPLVHPYALYRTRDCYFSIAAHDAKRSDLLLALAGHAEAVGDPRFEHDVARSIHADEYDALITPWLEATPRDELQRQFSDIQITAAPAQTFAEVLADPHFAARGVWTAVEGPGGRRVTAPGAWATEVRSATVTAQPGPDGTGGTGALAGLRVLDLGSGWAGPQSTRWLADLGADVVRLEPPWERGLEAPEQSYVDYIGVYRGNNPGERFWMTMGLYNQWSYGKRVVSARTNTPAGKEILRRLVGWADVLVENYSTRAAEKLGLTPEWIHTENPSIVSVCMPGFGRSGPLKDRVSWGYQVEAFTGATELMGYEDGPPHMVINAWTDPLTALFACCAALAAVRRRSEDGAGHHLEVAHVDAALESIGPEIVRFGLTGKQPDRRGNRHPQWAPHGVYPCAGADRWVAIAVTTDAEWLALAEAIERPDLAGDASLATAEERRGRHAELDRAVAAWTRTVDAIKAMHALQSAGIPAFVAYTAKDMVEDPHLATAGGFLDIGGETLPGFAFNLSRTPPSVQRGVPDIGEHNLEILSALGYSGAEIEELAEAGVIAFAPDRRLRTEN